MNITCKAVVTDGKGTYSLQSIVVSSPQEDEVRIKLKASGLCHTDYDSLSWGKPMIIGHEGAGIVQEVGHRIKHVKVGDKVVLNWAVPCGSCFQCKLGNFHICETSSPVTGGKIGTNLGHAHPEGSTLDSIAIERSFHLGTLSEYTLVKANAVTKITSKKISFEAAAIMGCGVMTGYGSVMNAAKVKRGSSVVVIGIGGVGTSIIQASKIAKAKIIIAIDTNPARLERALSYGATHTVLADTEDKGLLRAAERIRALTDNRGADYAFECTAIPDLGAAPLAMIRNAGMAVQVSGIEQEIPFDMNLFEWDKIYINPLYGQCNPAKDFKRIQRRYDKGQLILEEMISNTYALADIDRAFEDLLQGKNTKGVVVF